MDAHDIHRLADDGGPLAAIEHEPTVIPPAPVKEKTLAPFEPSPWQLGLGWKDTVVNHSARRPLVVVKALAPIDPDRHAKVRVEGVLGLIEKAKAAAAELPVVGKVRGLRAELAVVQKRHHEIEQRQQAARAERAAIIAAEPTAENAARFPILELELARYEHQLRQTEREANAISAKIPAAVREGDYTLKAFGRSAADVRSRELANEVVETIKRLDGELFERVLILVWATNETRNGGDMVYSGIRSLLGPDLPQAELEIQPDPADWIEPGTDKDPSDANLEMERLNAMPNRNPPKQLTHYDDGRGNRIPILGDGERIPDYDPFAASRPPVAADEAVSRAQFAKAVGLETFAR